MANVRDACGKMTVISMILTLTAISVVWAAKAVPGEPCGTPNIATPDTSSCAIYYKCDRDNHIWITRICLYPDLYSDVSNSCETFDSVDCKERKIPLSPCEYIHRCMTNETGTCMCQTHSVYKDANWGFCVGKADGNYPYQQRLSSPYYIQCKNNRTIPSTCEQNEEMIFDQFDKICKLEKEGMNHTPNTITTAYLQEHMTSSSVLSARSTTPTPSTPTEHSSTSKTMVIPGPSTEYVQELTTSKTMQTEWITDSGSGLVGKPTTSKGSEQSSVPTTRQASSTIEMTSGSGINGQNGMPTANPGSSNSGMPTANPGSSNSGMPTADPGSGNSGMPTANPGYVNSGMPTADPGSRNSGMPTANPGSGNSGMPTANPGSGNSGMPTANPGSGNSGMPTANPLSGNSEMPTANPGSGNSGMPTANPLSGNSEMPTANPGSGNTGMPTTNPGTGNSGMPTANPGSGNSGMPTANPGSGNSGMPTANQGSGNSGMPTANPGYSDSGNLTASPGTDNSELSTASPGSGNSGIPTASAGSGNSGIPTASPGSSNSGMSTASQGTDKTGMPTASLNTDNTGMPTDSQGTDNTGMPTASQGTDYIGMPTASPNTGISRIPTTDPGSGNSGMPTASPSTDNTGMSTANQGSGNSRMPTASPGTDNTEMPTASPSTDNTGMPTASPSTDNTGMPTANQGSGNSGMPTVSPGTDNTEMPTASQGIDKTGMPTANQGSGNTEMPTASPNTDNTGMSTASPETGNSGMPTASQGGMLTGSPGTNNIEMPTLNPGSSYSGNPTGSPGSEKNGNPTLNPEFGNTRNSTESPVSGNGEVPTLNPASNYSTNPIASAGSSTSGEPTTMPSSGTSEKSTAGPEFSHSQSSTDSPQFGHSGNPTDSTGSDKSGKPTKDPSSGNAINTTTSLCCGKTDLPTTAPETGHSPNPTANPSSGKDGISPTISGSGHGENLTAVESVSSEKHTAIPGSEDHDRSTLNAVSESTASRTFGKTGIHAVISGFGESVTPTASSEVRPSGISTSIPGSDQTVMFTASLVSSNNSESDMLGIFPTHTESDMKGVPTDNSRPETGGRVVIFSSLVTDTESIMLSTMDFQITNHVEKQLEETKSADMLLSTNEIRKSANTGGEKQTEGASDTSIQTLVTSPTLQENKSMSPLAFSRDVIQSAAPQLHRTVGLDDSRSTLPTIRESTSDPDYLSVFTSSNADQSNTLSLQQFDKITTYPATSSGEGMHKSEDQVRSTAGQDATATLAQLSTSEIASFIMVTSEILNSKASDIYFTPILRSAPEKAFLVTDIPTETSITDNVDIQTTSAIVRSTNKDSSLRLSHTKSDQLVNVDALSDTTELKSSNSIRHDAINPTPASTSVTLVDAGVGFMVSLASHTGSETVSVQSIIFSSNKNRESHHAHNSKTEESPTFVLAMTAGLVGGLGLVAVVVIVAVVAKSRFNGSQLRTISEFCDSKESPTLKQMESSVLY